MGGVSVQQQMCNLHALTVNSYICRDVIDPLHLTYLTPMTRTLHTDSQQLQETRRQQAVL